MDDAEFERRLNNRLPKDHPDYDPFFDATDAELAEMIPPFGDTYETQTGGTDG